MRCKGIEGHASVIAFAELISGGSVSEAPVFADIASESVVFHPDSFIDVYGTEDPRVTYDPATGLIT